MFNYHKTKNPTKPNRQSIRLRGYDYSSPGYYFITACTQNRECLFGDVVHERMALNGAGKIVENVWESLPNHHPVELDMFQIMPNHVHFILIVGATRGSPVNGSRPDAGGSRPAPTVGTIVGLFKSECTKQIRRFVNKPELRIWQRNYYEHIIRTEIDLEKIREYIQINPQMWDRDRNNPAIRRTN